ncbi:MAG: zinc-ribbon domain-containing protein [Lachnospiraceae bacterium]|nr:MULTISPECIES: zinc-ribbon domain-containing protein [Clostridia]MBS5191416.1 zinc-ribbon domain-containing protein [Lachnospiraceae bacterium]RHV67786.1 zinc-ribbon domain-containing protein [Roseburia sp. OM02-15]
MFCPKCGKQLDDGAKFCFNCGFSIESVNKNA